MPIGIEEWRAGIALCMYGFLTKSSANFLDRNVLPSVYCLAQLYAFFWLFVLTLPLSVHVTPFLSCLFDVYGKTLIALQVILCFVMSLSLCFFHKLITICHNCAVFRRRVVDQVQRLAHFVFIVTLLDCVSFVDVFSLNFLLFFAGDIETNPGPHRDNSLKFFHWNLNSICARGNIKISLIEAYNSVHRFDVIALSESMLNSSVNNEDIFIEGFSKEVYRSDHPSNSRKGGVCLYFREALPNKRRVDLELLQEFIVAEITIARKKIFFITLYRSPSQNSEQFEEFVTNLQTTIDQIQRERPHSLIITGDFNCRSSQWWEADVESPEGAALDEIIEVNNLTQLIDEPTNVRGEGMSCIDLIITDNPNLFVESGVHVSLDSQCQHQIIYGKLSISMPSPPPFQRTLWDYSKADLQSIQHKINAIDWDSRFNGLGSDEMADILTNELYSILSSNIPNKVVTCNDRDPPWITPELKHIIKRKQRTYRKFVQRGRRDEDWERVKNVRNATSKQIKNTKEKYFSNLGKKLSNPNHGLKEYWSSLNRLINKKNTQNIPPLLENDSFVINVQEKANLLNNYFAEQCCTVSTASTLPELQPRCDAELQSVVIDRTKVLALIRTLDIKKAHGFDNISISMIKMCDDAIVEPLCLIFEKSLETGVYPSIWKKANIIPIHKKGSRQCKNNYRPISLLPIFGKIFEKTLFDVIYEHLCNNGLLTPHQSGFRPGDSTINQLLAITHKIYTAFEELPSKETRAVFLDLSKAFDRVWHDGLIYKLQCSGISGNLLSLTRNFLNNRLQRVVLNGKSSEWASVSAGVPQGSVLGPLFFLVYINDIVDNLHCDVKIFADDTSLFSVVTDIDETADKLNTDLERVQIWAWQWKMKFNADKTEQVVFSSKRVRPTHPPLFLGNDEVNVKTEHKHLGMILDSKLNFESHIKEAIVKARRGIGMIRYLSKYVSRDVLDQIYKLYVRPHLDYGDIIYHRDDPQMHLNFSQRLEQTQYSAALAVTGAWRGTSKNRLYDELGWETLYHRRWYRRLCHFFKLIKSRSPEYLFSEIPPERQVVYNLRNPRVYDDIISRTVRFSNTYFNNAIHEWNLLDDEIKNSKSISEFKRRVLEIIRPVRHSTYNISDINGVRHLSRIRLKFSALNEHKFRHKFDCISPSCACGEAIEDDKHFLLHCPLYEPMRRNLLGQLSDIPGINITSFNTESLCELLLYGSPNLCVVTNRIILEATIDYIKTTKRFC